MYLSLQNCSTRCEVSIVHWPEFREVGEQRGLPSRFLECVELQVIELHWLKKFLSPQLSFTPTELTRSSTDHTHPTRAVEKSAKLCYCGYCYRINWETLAECWPEYCSSLWSSQRKRITNFDSQWIVTALKLRHMYQSLLGFRFLTQSPVLVTKWSSAFAVSLSCWNLASLGPVLKNDQRNKPSCEEIFYTVPLIIYNYICYNFTLSSKSVFPKRPIYFILPLFASNALMGVKKLEEVWLVKYVVQILTVIGCLLSCTSE